MTAKRFIFMAAILLLLCTGLGIYGFVKASEHPKDYQSAGEIRWGLPPPIILNTSTVSFL